mmetsp:Transcript_167786/g.538865  ORF Transcript_167786/g.538865 Transcript_167786/m.538865 type:complete len:313 (-) Transcript_167786:101-1039(-)
MPPPRSPPEHRPRWLRRHFRRPLCLLTAVGVGAGVGGAERWMFALRPSGAEPGRRRPAPDGDDGAAARGRVSCFGDSHTEGIFGAPWVPDLQRRLARECRNHGRNAWTAESVARCAEAAEPSQDATVLVGTNNVMMELAWRADNQAMISLYKAINGLPSDYRPSAATFSGALRRLLAALPVDRLRGRVAVASLPPLGEAERGPAAEVVAEYNAAIRAVVAEDPRAVYVPFGESLLGTKGEAFDASYGGFSGSIAEMYWHTGRRWLLPGGPSFGTQAAECGRTVVHDKIHLTEVSASKLSDLFVDALESSGVE